MEEKDVFEDKGDIDQFVNKVYATGISLAVTIPKPTAEFSGLKEGDMIKVWFKIIKEKTDIKQN